MADLGKVKRNVAKMVGMGAPEADIDAYIAGEGTTIDEVRAFKDTAAAPTLSGPAMDAAQGYREPPGSMPGINPDGSPKGGWAAVDAVAPQGGQQAPRVDPHLIEERRARLQQGLAAARVPGWQSALGGAVDTATFGFGDELAAGLKTGAGLWGNYDQTLDEERAKFKSAQEANPALYMGGQVVGAIPSMAIPGTNVVRGAGLLNNAARVGLAGGAMGAAYGFGSADGGVTDRAVGAGVGGLTGGLIGGAVPFAGRAVGAGFNAITGRGAENAAGSLFTRAAGADNLADALSVQQALERLGPQGMPADLGPNLQHQAAALAASPGAAQDVVRDALVARQQGANGRILGDIDATLGPAPVPTAVDAGLVAGQRALSPEYAAALNGAQAVDTSRLALDLDSQVVNLRGRGQRAAQDVRSMLNVNGQDVLDPNPATLMETRKAIDGMLATEADPNAVRVLSGARAQVDELLAEAVPGIKDVDARFAALARQREALQRGQQVLDSGRTAPRPVELETELAAASPEVQARLREGARAEIDRIVGTNANDVVALQRLLKGEGSWNRDRLATLFGADRADQILAVLERERTFADTANIVTRNSETAARLAAQGEVAPAPSDATAGVIRSLLNLRAGDAVARGLGAVTGAAGNAARQNRNAELAALLTAQGPQVSAAVESVAQAIARRNRALAVERGVDLALAAGGRGTVASAY